MQHNQLIEEVCETGMCAHQQTSFLVQLQERKMYHYTYCTSYSIKHLWERTFFPLTCLQLFTGDLVR